MAKSKRKRQRKRGSRRQPPHRRLTETEREFESALADVHRRAAEAHSPDTSPDRVAAILVEDFEDMPAPVGFTGTLAEQGIERARAVAAEVDRLAPGSLLALTFAAELARTVDGDLERSEALIEQACDSHIHPAATGPFAMHLLNAGRLLEALHAAERCLLEDPTNETGTEAQAGALELLHGKSESGARLERDEREALERFNDRGVLDRLREKLGEFVAEQPELQERIAATVREWLFELTEDDASTVDELAEFGGGMSSGRTAGRAGDRRRDPADRRGGARAGLVSLAIERGWLREHDEAEDELDELELELETEPELEDATSPLALLATDPSTSLEIANAAGMWIETCTYGLWQLSDPTPGPGVWLTDIISGADRYAAIPPDLLEHASRWSVLMGPLVALDGVWRTTGAAVMLRPSEADEAAEFVRGATTDIVRALAGKRIRRDAKWRSQPTPHGVLADAGEAASPMLADLISKILGNLLPTIASELWRRRATGPGLDNTDGHPLTFIAAQVNVDDPSSAAEPLATQEGIDAWLEHWPSGGVPALGQLTPRVAARRKDKRPYLEAVLREFEHDAYLLEREGKPAPDIGHLRAELGMQR